MYGVPDDEDPKVVCLMRPPISELYSSIRKSVTDWLESAC